MGRRVSRSVRRVARNPFRRRHHGGGGDDYEYENPNATPEQLQQIENYKKQVEDLQNKYNELQRGNVQNSDMYKQLQGDYNTLSNKYLGLGGKYEDLNSKYLNKQKELGDKQGELDRFNKLAGDKGRLEADTDVQGLINKANKQDNYGVDRGQIDYSRLIKKISDKEPLDDDDTDLLKNVMSGIGHGVSRAWREKRRSLRSKIGW